MTETFARKGLLPFGVEQFFWGVRERCGASGMWLHSMLSRPVKVVAWPLSSGAAGQVPGDCGGVPCPHSAVFPFLFSVPPLPSTAAERSSDSCFMVTLGSS